MEKIRIIKVVLIAALCMACHNTPKTETLADSLALATNFEITQTPEQFIGKIEGAIAEGDSMLNSLDENQESLEGGEEMAFFTPNLEISKIRKVNFGETYQNIENFYFKNGKLLVLTSENLKYNKSTYDESPEPLVMKSEGKFLISYNENGEKIQYKKLNEKRRYEDNYSENQEIEYWKTKGAELFEKYDAHKDEFFFSKYEAAQYDEMGVTPSLVFKLKNQMYSFIDQSVEPDEKGRMMNFEGPMFGVSKLIYDARTEKWKHSQRATILDLPEGKMEVNEGIKNIILEGHSFLYITFSISEKGTNSSYYTLVDTIDLSTISLIKSKGKDNSATISSEAIRKFLLENSK
jgi:hypothetical protein